MTKSAKGTVEAPGKQVKQKSGLNRSILASGWGSLERKLEYKAGDLRKVNPAYTSQTCSRCGHVHRDNRPSQAVFACGACGFRANADHNAAINILVRAGLPCVPVSARGTGAAARRGAIPWGPRRPVNEMGQLSSPAYKSHLMWSAGSGRPDSFWQVGGLGASRCRTGVHNLGSVEESVKTCPICFLTVFDRFSTPQSMRPTTA